MRSVFALSLYNIGSMRIDLHCHTKAVKSGEGGGRNVQREQFVKAVADAGVGIVAITNHNTFDVDQYNDFSRGAGSLFQVWPGVELDVEFVDNGDKRTYHMVLICSPSNAEKLKMSVDKLVAGVPPDEFSCSVEQIIESMDGMKYVLIPHFNKEPGITEDEGVRVKELLDNNSAVLLEAQNVRSMCIFINHGINAIVGSDVRDWSGYPGKDLPSLRIPVDSFEKFFLLLRRDEAIVQSLLKNKESVVAKVDPCFGSVNPSGTEETVEFFNDINVIIGDKGTGKSNILLSLEHFLRDNGRKCSCYVGTGTVDSLRNDLSTNDMDRSAGKLNIDGCREEFRYVREWLDVQPTLLLDFVNYAKFKDRRNKVGKIKWCNLGRLGELPDDAMRSIESDYERVCNATEIIESIDLESYGLSDDIVLGLKSLRKLILEKKKETLLQKYAVYLTNFTLSTFNHKISAKVDAPSRPMEAGFIDFAHRRLALFKKVKKICDLLTAKDNSSVSSYTPLGSIGDKGEVYIEERYRLLDACDGERSDKSEFSGNITKLRGIAAKLKGISDAAIGHGGDVSGMINDLSTLCEDAGVHSLDDFVGLSKFTVDGNYHKYELSNGERAMLYIQRTLNDSDADAFLLDEPELGIANVYIDEVVRPKLLELAREHKMVVIVTHNANLAVRTLPYMTMYRRHSANGYSSYIGNPFTNGLYNIKNDSDVLQWRSVNMSILEGGAEAFCDRGDIYGRY